MNDATTPRVLFSSEEDDVQAAARGQKSAFDRLVLRYQTYVFNTARSLLRNREDALDVTQDVFLKAYCGIERFRRDASFKTWIFRITLNAANSFRARTRARKRAGRIISLDGSTSRESHDSTRRRLVDPEDPRADSSPVALSERRELLQALEKAIADLDPEYRKIVVLRDLVGESYEKIARTLNSRLGTVKSKIHRARRSLQARMAAHV